MCAFTPLLLGATALAAVGSVVQGNQAAAMGNAQRAAYYQAASAEQASSSYEATRVAEQARRAQSAALTHVADSGVLLTGSPTDVLADNAVHAQMDIQAIQFGSKIKQGNLMTQGDLAQLGGQQRQQAGYIGAATNVASGLTQLYTPRSAVRFGGNAFGSSAVGSPGTLGSLY